MNSAPDAGKDKAGSAVVEFSSADELKEAMRNDPVLAEQVMKDLRVLEEEERAKSADRAPKTIDKPSDKGSEKPPEKPAGAGEGRKAPEQGAPPDKGKDGQQAPPEDELVTVRLPKSLMGTYLKNRTPDEAAVEMAKGYREKDRTIDFLKSSRQELSEKLAESINELQAEAAKSQEITKQLEALKAQAAAAPAGGAPKAEVRTPEGGKVTLPAIPARPKRPKELKGDDLLDEAKISKYEKEVEAYDSAYDEYQAAVEARAKAVDQLIESRTGENESLRRDLENAKKELADVKTGVQQVDTRVQAAESRDKATEQTYSEYANIDNFREEHPELFPSERPIQEIEADYIRFLQELASAVGIQGGIHVAGTPQIKPDLWAAFQTYRNQPESDQGKKLHEQMKLLGTEIPQDYEELDRIYRIRKVMEDFPERGPGGKYSRMNYERALHMASYDHEDLRVSASAKPPSSDEPPQGAAKPQAKSPAQEKMEEVEARERAAKAREKFAKEPDPTGSAQGIDVDNFSSKAWAEIVAKKPAERTEYDKQVIAAVCARFGMKESEFTG